MRFYVNLRRIQFRIVCSHLHRNEFFLNCTFSVNILFRFILNQITPEFNRMTE